MNQSKKDVELGRFISLVLRHNPQAIGISLDENGWANTQELINGINRKGKKITQTDLERIVRENSKKRYVFNEDKSKIRANQGHSIDVDVELKQVTAPNVLYHGTADRFVSSILEAGIEKRSRQYVHLSDDIVTATKVGSRHGKPAILKIDAKRMQEQDLVFYLSENNVWLCDYVPAQFIEVLK